MAHIKYLLVSLLPLLLAACGGGTDGGSRGKEEVYDYRAERYQDFYSRYMRKTQQDHLIIRSQNIKEKLGIENIPDDVLARMNIYQANPQKAKNTPENNLQTQADVINFLNRNGDHYAPCGPENQEPHFFCVDDKKSPGSLRYYYYLPNESKKMAYIDQSLSFTCHPDDGKKRCRMTNWTTDPVNLKLTMHFINPQNFFYIIPYAEKHFYDAMGEHIWQNKAK